MVAAPLRVQCISSDAHVEAVAAIYCQHFLIDANTKNRDVFLKDMLTSKYKEWPPATNFSSCRTLALLHNDTVVCATTVRVHKMSQYRFVEVILFATHQKHLKRGYGRVLSSFLLAKAHEQGCRKILLRSSNHQESVFFWCSQGYTAYPFSKSDAVMAYYDHHCLAFPETVLMQRDVGSSYPWVEYALGKCAVSQALEDYGANLLSTGSRARHHLMSPTSDPASSSSSLMFMETVVARYESMPEPTDPEIRKACGLFDNQKLTAEQMCPPKPTKRKFSAVRTITVPSIRESSAAVVPTTELSVQLELGRVRKQIDLLRKRRAQLQASINTPLTAGPVGSSSFSASSTAAAVSGPAANTRKRTASVMMESASSSALTSKASTEKASSNTPSLNSLIAERPLRPLPQNSSPFIDVFSLPNNIWEGAGLTPLPFGCHPLPVHQLYNTTPWFPPMMPTAMQAWPMAGLSFTPGTNGFLPSSIGCSFSPWDGQKINPNWFGCMANDLLFGGMSYPPTPHCPPPTAQLTGLQLNSEPSAASIPNGNSSSNVVDTSSSS